MLIEVLANSPVPIYDQIVTQFIFNVAADGPDVEILSVRELALKLGVNPNTVARAYQELQRMGVLAALRGTGMELTPDAVGICRAKRQEIVRGRVRAALQEAVASALTPDEVRRLVEDELTRVNGKAKR